MVRLLVLFLYDEKLTDFRLPELRCVAETLGVDVTWEGTLAEDSVFLLADFGSLEGARRVADRCMLVRGLFELWAQGPDYPTLLRRLQEAQHLVAAHLTGKTFKYIVESFGRSYSHAQQLALIQQFQGIGPGKAVSLHYPETTLWVFEDIGRKEPADTPPKQVYHARELHLSIHNQLRAEYSLKKRTYLGTTSMPADLSFLMANMARVQRHQLVMDCFCGTASILVAAAHHGAHCYGVEIDPRVLRGRTPGVNVFSNFKQYRLEEPEFIRGDMARRFFWRSEELFDAILTDPPYGARAGSRKVDEATMGRVLENSRVAPRSDAPIIPTEGYALGTMLADLLEFAARMLVVGGRLVFWLPTTEQYSDRELPAHPCLTLLYNTGQPITIRLHRRLLTFEKTKRFEGERAVEPAFSPDVKHLDFHSDTYLKYRAKVERKRAAVRQFKESCGTGNAPRPDAGVTAADGSPTDPSSGEVT
eukprot:GGOE01018374.1.p1 GENE.GGOE01018374.1~~GGOE01018374.1.p1  ORF type:complete len:475 (-),score=171.79 GGOE01018374.1:300-1724(-)